MRLQGSNRSNSSMGFRVASTTIHHPARGVSSGGAISSVCSSFISILHFLTLMWSVAFLCLASSLSCAILSQKGLLEVPVTYLRSLGYYLARGLVLVNGYS
jgi:hypothetical protein